MKDDRSPYQKAVSQLEEAQLRVSRSAQELSCLAEQQDDGSFVVDKETMEDLRAQLTAWTRATHNFVKTCREGTANEEGECHTCGCMHTQGPCG